MFIFWFWLNEFFGTKYRSWWHLMSIALEQYLTGNQVWYRHLLRHKKFFQILKIIITVSDLRHSGMGQYNLTSLKKKRKKYSRAYLQISLLRIQKLIIIQCHRPTFSLKQTKTQVTLWKLLHGLFLPLYYQKLDTYHQESELQHQKFACTNKF